MAENILERITFKSGDRIFGEGEAGYRAFIVQEGEIDIIKEIDNTATVLASVGKGGIIGEMALIDSSPRMATARAKTAGVVIVVTSDMFNSKLAKADPFIRGLLKILTDHLRRLSGENVMLQARLKEISSNPVERIE